jgi:hypothetical protein
MSFEVTEEPLDRVRGAAVSLLNATRRDPIDESRFDWMYRSNPDGPAVLWSVRETGSADLAGFTVALPRRMIVDGELRSAWNCADFSMDPRYRTLGPAIKLRRAAREGVDAGRVDFLYAHPNPRMAVIHARVGHHPIGRMLRFARAVRLRAHLERRLRPPVLARSLAAVTDPLVRLLSRETRCRVKHDVKLVSPARFDHRFDTLFEDTSRCVRTVGVRDTRYLAWRYAQIPLYESHLLTAESGGRLKGFLVFLIEDDVFNVKDLFPPNDPSAAADLVAALLRLAWTRGVSSVSFAVLEECPLIPVLKEFGFRQRPGTSEMYGYTPPQKPVHSVVLSRGSWFLTVGDRDV